MNWLKELRSRWWFWLDKRHGRYDHAHSVWYDAGSGYPDPEPACVDACWCPIGKDHDA